MKERKILICESHRAMKSVFLTPIHLIVATTVLILAISYLPVFYEFLTLMVLYPKLLIPFGSGALAFVGANRLVVRNRKGMWSTFEHELTHAIMSMLLFAKVMSLKAADASDGDGHLGVVCRQNTGHFRSILIGLAPYFSATYTWFLFLFLPFVSDEAMRWFKGLLGFTFAYHMWSTWKEIGFHQSDLTTQGKAFSAIFLGATNFIVIPATILVGISDLSAGGAYLAEGPLRIWSLLRAVGTMTYHFILQCLPS